MELGLDIGHLPRDVQVSMNIDSKFDSLTIVLGARSKADVVRQA
jgi:hypothetical protein